MEDIKEMQVKKKMQQEKRHLLLAGGLAPPLDRWKERRLAVHSSCLSLIMKWEHLSILAPDCIVIYFAHVKEGRASPNKLLDKLEVNITTLSPPPPPLFFFFLLFLFLLPHKTDNEKQDSTQMSKALV